ncbi:unnamed protein product [Lupinus luteus]|uniref:Uncharacterized protein n=1 Tax=Lupinus luteus TaxID=3873 RepID=A0AAV1VZI5_LUPLU
MNSHKIRIRNGGCSAYTSIVDYKPEQAIGSWNYGVELQWQFHTHSAQTKTVETLETILQSPLNCTSTSICKQYEEKVEEGKGCKNTLCCHYLKDSAMNSRKIRIRNGGCSAYTSIVDYKPEQAIGSWNYGVELQWLPAKK